jgi:transcription initiation factor TFIIIB Brf1 subunit/transcription initiation factor TFIIB
MADFKTDSTEMCKHVIFESDGFFVCVKCAFVQDIALVSDYPSNITNIENDINQPLIKLNEKIDIITELKFKGVINEQVLQDSLFYLKKWCNDKIPIQKMHHAYAVYFSARKNQYPLSLKEISFYLQISVKDICKVEKYIKHDFTDCPYDYISKYCVLLDLTFMDEKIITAFLNTNYKVNTRNPSHVAAAAIINVFPSISRKKISKVTWAAPATLKKIAHDLRNGLFK